MNERRRPLIIALGLLVAVVASAYPILANGFVNYDDNFYVTANPHVQAGLTADGVIWAFNVGFASNWHPLTWLWHMLEYDVVGASARGHHLVSLLMHLANTLLLFAALRRLTGADWRSGMVAALFAVHPLNVESVAWVAEQKNLLSTMFWLATMWAYAAYADRPRAGRYAAVVLLFALGLMAKPMLVTLPCVLLLLDYWPLGRLASGGVRGAARLVIEKLPLFALSIASCVLTYLAQAEAMTMQSHALHTRIANAVVAYLSYIEKMLWPQPLAVHYPHPGSALAAGPIAVAALVLGIVSALVVWRRRKQPYLVTGWLWFLGTMVPVIGIVQVGTQASADRYAYVPLIGLFIMIAWSIPDLLPAGRRRDVSIAAAAIAVIAALGVRTWQQSRYWRDSLTLFRHALDVTTDNAMAHNNLADALVEAGQTSEAREHFEAALRLHPADPLLERRIRMNLAIVLTGQGEQESAIELYEQLLREDSDDVEVLINLGVALAGRQEYERAIELLERARRAAPDRAEIPYNLGLVYGRMQHVDRSVELFRQALKLAPQDAKILSNLGVALARQGRIEEAIRYLSKAVAIDPDYAPARRNLALVENWKQQRSRQTPP